MKLALGTAQFGLDYGISNRGGQVPADEVRRVLEVAASAGLRVIDTAAAYGDAERELGRLLPASHAFALVTKLPRLPQPPPPDVTAWVRDRLDESLRHLRLPRIEGLLVHAAAELLGPQGRALWQGMLGARDRGVVAKVGASVYTAAEIDALLARYPLQLVQLPLNLFDQRLARSGHLAALRRAGVEVHARSVFLQGLLLMAPGDLPGPFFDAARPALRQLEAAACRAGCSPLRAALAWVIGRPEVSHAVVGVTRARELEEIVAAARAPAPPGDWAALALDDEAILNPVRWPVRP